MDLYYISGRNTPSTGVMLQFFFSFPLCTTTTHHSVPIGNPIISIPMFALPRETPRGYGHVWSLAHSPQFPFFCFDFRYRLLLGLVHGPIDSYVIESPDSRSCHASQGCHHAHHSRISYCHGRVTVTRLRTL